MGTMSGIDIWRRGAARMLEKQEQEVSIQERQLFKETFFNMMHLYFYQSDDKNLAHMKWLIDQFAQCIKGNLSFEATEEFIVGNLPEEMR